MTVISSTNKGAYPDVSFFPAEDVVPDALILQVADRGPVIEGDQRQVRAPFVADDIDAGFVAEGVDIETADPDIDELVYSTDKIAVLSKVSREAYQTEGVAGLLTSSFKRSVIAKADNAFLKNASNPTGISLLAGIVDGGTLDTDFDALVDLIAELEQNGATPSHIVASPAAWAYVRKLKAGAGLNTPLVGSTQDVTAPALMGLPVLVNRAAPADTLLVLDKSQIIASVGDVSVASSTERYFEADSVALRLTMRIGWGVVRANRLGKLALI